ncbi:MAG: lipopolysaccharide biosynthesis protein, partial [Gammaproteobacteria bacterium]|nr:lipopolysaccharide biosynthesis protein [Gammaproteobacteria bacterium]
SWQTVIHYGARCLEEGRRTDLQRLVKFTLLLDVAGAVVGTVLAVAIAPVVGTWLGWSEDAVPL